MRFNQELSHLTPLDFVRQVLVHGLAARHVVVGEDFRFGYQRAGNLELLSAMGRDFGFSVEALAAVAAGGERISSTAVRHALSQSDFSKAECMLGRPFSMEGRVVRGQQLGRTLGYPTANLRVRAQPCPLHGIYAVRACLADEGTRSWLPGVCSLGRRPTVGGGELLLEVHLFDFDVELYGKRLQVEFVAKLRDESHFEDIDSMVVQMKHDEQQARDILAKHKHPA
jgi:riboflavin kinase/FMN adenylyltransferase